MRTGAVGRQTAVTVYKNGQVHSNAVVDNGRIREVGHVNSPMLGTGPDLSQMKYYDTTVPQDIISAAYRTGICGTGKWEPASTLDDQLLRHHVPHESITLGEWQTLSEPIITNTNMMVMRNSQTGGVVVFIPCVAQSPCTASREIASMSPDAYHAHHRVSTTDQILAVTFEMQNTMT
jgi:hypothetical protein